MRLLLDTHVFLWFVTATRDLPAGWRDAIRDPSNTVYVSVASIWEAVIKYRLGKLPLPEPPEIYLLRDRERHGLLSLGIDEETACRVAQLPDHHRDPFDRILVAQAVRHDLTWMTEDQDVRRYPARLIAPW